MFSVLYFVSASVIKTVKTLINYFLSSLTHSVQKEKEWRVRRGSREKMKRGRSEDCFSSAVSTCHKAMDRSTCDTGEAETLSRLDVSSEQEECRGRSDAGDHCESICRFANTSYNCWMNASLQAVLNLKYVQKKIVRLPPDKVIYSSITPKFGEVFWTALKNPGRTFNPAELYDVLKELSEEIPSLYLDKCNDVLELVQLLLAWLDKSGVQTMKQTKVSIRCYECGFTSLDTSDLNIYFLSPPNNFDSISSLLTRTLNECTNLGHCVKCGAIVQKEQTVDYPEILTLYLPRTSDIEYRKVVLPCPIVELPMDESTTQVYSLSSVICHRSLFVVEGHYWSYLIKDDVIIEANDDKISVSNDVRDVCFDGVIFFYERCT